MATQTCDRTVTGRNFDYASALNISQSETYLEQEDLNEIGLYHRQGEVLQAIENFDDKHWHKTVTIWRHEFSEIY